jgi:DNA adenine methylase
MALAPDCSVLAQISINDTPAAREVFGRFAFDEVETTYTLATVHGGGKKVGELVVRGPA